MDACRELGEAWTLRRSSPLCQAPPDNAHSRCTARGKGGCLGEGVSAPTSHDKEGLPQFATLTEAIRCLVTMHTGARSSRCWPLDQVSLPRCLFSPLDPPAEIQIPQLCHHPALTPVGSCRLCLVDVGGSKLVRCPVARHAV